MVIAQFPGDRAAIFAMLQRTLGNAFAQQVIASSGAEESALAKESSELVDASEPSSIDRLREQTEVAADTNARPGQPTCKPVASNDAAVTALVNRQPTGAGGPDGYAAWLKEAQRLCLVTIPTIMTYEQLNDLVAGRPVRTYEFDKDHDVGPAREAARKKATKGKLDNAHRAPGTRQQWDIDLTVLPILETLVAVTRKRINEWQKVGGPAPKVLSLGQFVRADMWYDTGEKVPPHEPGAAIDLFFVGRVNTAADVLELLEDLPPVGTIEVFRDNNNALHLDRRPTGYGLGVPAAGDFIDSDMAIDDNGKCPAQRKAEATGDPSKGTIDVRGVVNFSSKVLRRKATFHDGAWAWGAWTETNESVLDHLRNPKLKPALEAFGKRK